MKYVRILAPLGAILALAAAPSAQAAAGTPVTIRIEGKTHTLRASTVVHLKSGWLTRGGALKGECPTTSAAGALDQATRHRWGATFSTQFNDYFITSILGEKYASTASYYWEIFDGKVAATTGACQIAAHRGQQLVFAAVPVADYGDYLLAITGAPRHASVGHAFTVKVVYYDASGKARALAGSKLTAGGETVATNAHGVATVTPTKAGKLVLAASHAETHKGGHLYGYVRAATVRMNVS